MCKVMIIHRKNVQRAFETKPIAIDFYATWCGPCRVISPKFEELAARTPEVAFYKVDVDEQPEIAGELQIRAVGSLVYASYAGE